MLRRLERNVSVILKYYVLARVFLKGFCWAMIFITRLRFPRGASLPTSFNLSLCVFTEKEASIVHAETVDYVEGKYLYL